VAKWVLLKIWGNASCLSHNGGCVYGHKVFLKLQARELPSWLELWADFTVSASARQSTLIGGGAPPDSKQLTAVAARR